MNNCYDRRFATIIDFYYFLNSSLTDLRHHHLPDLLVLEGHLHLVLEGHFNLVLSMERSSTVGGGILHNTNLSHHHLSRWSLPLLESCLHLALPMERSSTVGSNEATYTDLSHYRLSDRSLPLLDDCLHPIERQALCKTGIPISDLSQYHLSQWSHLLLQGHLHLDLWLENPKNGGSKEATLYRPVTPSSALLIVTTVGGSPASWPVNSHKHWRGIVGCMCLLLTATYFQEWNS